MLGLSLRSLATLFLCLPLVSLAAESEPSGYLIQPGDILEISVWNEEGLKRQVPVRPDGYISLPLIGDVNASEKTVDQTRITIRDQLSKFIPDPVVTVTPLQLSGNLVYVIGKVQRPGQFPMTRYTDVVQALSMAGGMTPYAASNKIKILRRKNGQLTAIPFRYADIEKGESLEQNIVLKSGDVVLVP